MKAVWLGSLLLASCALPDRWFAWGAYGSEGDSSLGGKTIENGDGYEVGAGVSGPLFPTVTRTTRERVAPPEPLTLPDQDVESVNPLSIPNPGQLDPYEPWWKDVNLLAWIERVGLAALFILVGRHGEEALKKVRTKVQDLRARRAKPH